MELIYVKGHLLTETASKAKISNEYARKLITGDREPNTTRAKRFMLAAKALNEKVKIGTEKVDKILNDDDNN